MNLSFIEDIDDWDRVENSQSQSDSWKFLGLESQIVSRKVNYNSTKFPAFDSQVLKVVEQECKMDRIYNLKASANWKFNLM